MPVSVKMDDVPTFVRAGTVTKYADIFNYLTKWLREQAAIKDEKKRMAVAFTGLSPEQLELPEESRPENDGVTKDNWGQIASGIRRVAKELGFKVTLVYRDDEAREEGEPQVRLYTTFGGDFVPLTPAQIAQRKEKRRTNKITALTEKYVGEGMTEPNAKKRAAEEVGALKVV